MNIPLAEQLRPKHLEDYIGQKHLVGEGAVLRKAIDLGRIPSMILWGPPGVGKTTLALLISQHLKQPFYSLSAINSGVKDVRDVIDRAKHSFNSILFIDEIHRFNKSQQDSLLSAVEKGIVTLIGATTENPSFEVISPLLSRCQVYILKNLTEEELRQLLDTAVLHYKTVEKKNVVLLETEALMRISGGDARKMLNALEIVVASQSSKNDEIEITNVLVLDSIQQNLALYDKSGEMHYDVISAFIKSIRGSDPNAAVYYLARMIEAGEDPKFIARRLLILASEDIGNANPNAILLANACFESVNKIGYPECRIPLSQTTIYLATSPKSNASYLAIDKALDLVRKTGDLPVPLPIRNAPTKLMKDIGYGKDYKYAHDFEGNFAHQEFLPDAILETKIYEPQNNAREKELRAWLKSLWGEKYDY
ncbi:MAG: replication-associated recombination protein A [Bacteroidales bacterium]|jgi:putative ATPase|nr:replication-associated recombination protein A [Bacteroidales bacterium]